MIGHCFITGTDTDAGKTFSACALLHAWRARGFSAAGYKPVAAGSSLHQGKHCNADTLALQAASSPGLTPEDITPLCLPDACAPHIAAQRAGQRIDLAPLLAGYHALAARFDRVVVEGAGGFIVPLGPHAESPDMGTLAQQLALPVVLVVGLRLGCLNHALLTREAIAARGLTLAGWIGNVRDADMPFLAENLATLQQHLPAPCLGVFPHLPSPADAAPLWQHGRGVQLPPLARV